MLETTRSRIMASCRSSGTKPELAVRSFLHARGFRFVLGGRGLPGRPDIVLPRHKTVVFVHGCFWHGHLPCAHYLPPRANPAYWRPKIVANRRRDRRVARECRALGWAVIVVWECEGKDERLLRYRLRPLLEGAEPPSAVEGRASGSLAMLRFKLRSAATQARRFGARVMRAMLSILPRSRPPRSLDAASGLRPDELRDPCAELREGIDEIRYPRLPVVLRRSHCSFSITSFLNVASKGPAEII